MVDVLVGTPVTTVFYTLNGSRTRIGTVITTEPGTCLEIRVPGRANVVPRRYDREGITWIRGHHAPDSEQALALQAAWALSGYGHRTKP